MTLIQIRVKERQAEEIKRRMDECNNSVWRVIDDILDKAAKYEYMINGLVNDEDNENAQIEESA